MNIEEGKNAGSKVREKGKELWRRGESGSWWNGGLNKGEGTLGQYSRHPTLTIDSTTIIGRVVPEAHRGLPPTPP